MTNTQPTPEAQTPEGTELPVAEIAPVPVEAVRATLDGYTSVDGIFRKRVLDDMRKLDNPYHNDVHTVEVTERAVAIAEHVEMPLSEIDRENLRIAVLFHDAGHAGTTYRPTSERDIPRKDLSNEQYAVLLMREEIGTLLEPARLDVIERLILTTTFGEIITTYSPETTLEKIIVVADIGGFMNSFDEWAEESLLVLQETPPNAIPQSFEMWQKNRRMFLDNPVRDRLKNLKPLLESEYAQQLQRKLEETIASVATDLVRFKDKFESIRTDRLEKHEAELMRKDEERYGPSLPLRPADGEE